MLYISKMSEQFGFKIGVISENRSSFVLNYSYFLKIVAFLF